MKSFFVLTLGVLLFGFSLVTVAEAKVSVRGYTSKSGKYVMPHYRSSPNLKKYDNWSTKGNYNPYTFKPGYKTYFNY